MHYVILGTAGHIDHGKSALVKALTGIDPDRLKRKKNAASQLTSALQTLFILTDLQQGLLMSQDMRGL